ncbi:hypothetical protein B9Z65_7568 [Elsinoe australis]|uniref:Rhodopsin domain-containing protein n=1 Tax=Elsinoe australis TaxID=40998 RepID=A0A2P7ZZW5_9PEZI|nr:hypothetical protein B9Z65_7568 [Elsinoe australis]
MGTYGGLGPAILATLWSLCGVAFTLVFLRAYAASRKHGKWRWDFIHIAVAFVTAALAGIFITVGVDKGLGNYVKRLTYSQIWDTFYWFYLAIYAGTISIAFSKFSVIALLLEVQEGSQKRKRKYALWAVGAVFGIASLLEVFLTAFQCKPLSKVWNLAEDGTCPASKAAKAISYVHAATGGITDLILALWPISIVWNLQTAFRVKVGFCLLMAVGIVPAAAAFVRIQLLTRLHTAKDPTYESGLFLLSAAVEAASLIILCSIPPLRPLFIRVIWGPPTLSTGTRTTHPTATAASMGVLPRSHSLSVNNIGSSRAADDEEHGKADQAIVVSKAYKVEAEE